MKRIVLTLAALAFSTAALADQNPDNWGDVLQDKVAKSSSYNNISNGDIENHGSVVFDLNSPTRSRTRSVERGLDSEISVGGSDSVFEDYSEANF